MLKVVSVLAVAVFGAPPLFALGLADRGIPQLAPFRISDAADVPMPDAARMAVSGVKDGEAPPEEEAPDPRVELRDVPMVRNGNVTTIWDDENAFYVTVTRNGYGDYAVRATVENADISYEVHRLNAPDEPSVYLVRGEDVDLEFRQNGPTTAIITGHIPTPDGGDAIRVGVNLAGGVTIGDAGGNYYLHFNGSVAKGYMNTAVFSEGEASCMAGYAVAWLEDFNNGWAGPGPWYPYVPDPNWNYHHHPYPGHNPWNHHYPPQPVHPQPGGPHPGPHPGGHHPQPGPQPNHPQPAPQPNHPGPQPNPPSGGHHPQPGPQPNHPQPAPQPNHPQPAPQPWHPQPSPQPTPNPGGGWGGGHPGGNPGGHPGGGHGGHRDAADADVNDGAVN